MLEKCETYFFIHHVYFVKTISKLHVTDKTPFREHADSMFDFDRKKYFVVNFLFPDHLFDSNRYKPVNRLNK